MNQRALKWVASFCDIEERLRAVPPSARMRGLAFGPIKGALTRVGKVEAYEELFDHAQLSSMALYPLGEYLLRMACAGALFHSPERAMEGVFDISRGNARGYASSMLGRTLLRLLSNDPVRISEQGLAMRRQASIYGHWELVRHAPHDIEMFYYDEYVWIEHSVAAAALGTFEACGVTPTVDTQLRDRFNGSTRIRW